MEIPGLGLVEADIYHGHKCHYLKSPPCIFHGRAEYKAMRRRGKNKQTNKKPFYLICLVGARSTLVISHPWHSSRASTMLLDQSVLHLSP